MDPLQAGSVVKHTDGDMKVYESLATKEICIALHLVDYAKGWNVKRGVYKPAL